MTPRRAIIPDIVVDGTRYSPVPMVVGVGHYAGGGVALVLLDADSFERCVVATVNLPDGPTMMKDMVWLKGWSENEGVPEALERAGVVKLLEYTPKTGHAEARGAKLLAPVLEALAAERAA